VSHSPYTAQNDVPATPIGTGLFPDGHGNVAWPVKERPLQHHNEDPVYRCLATPLLFTALSVGCMEYDMQRIPEQEEGNWFEDAKDRTPVVEDEDDSPEDDSDNGGDAPGDSDTDAPDPDDDQDRPDEDDSNDDSNDDSDDDSNDDSDDDSDDWDWDWDDDDDSEPDAPGPGESSGTARAPGYGEMVVTELMIDPESVPDRDGEWVEIRNTSAYWVDLSGHRLGDDGVDDVEIESTSTDSLVVRPGGYTVICAVDDYWDNGGVECDGTFRYWTFGGGFAMSNTEDEVMLISPGGYILDGVAWGEDFAVVGAAMGLEASAHTVGDNDALESWCDQWSWLPLGDAGTPSEANDSCW